MRSWTNAVAGFPHVSKCIFDEHSREIDGVLCFACKWQPRVTSERINLCARKTPRSRRTRWCHTSDQCMSLAINEGRPHFSKSIRSQWGVRDNAAAQKYNNRTLFKSFFCSSRFLELKTYVDFMKYWCENLKLHILKLKWTYRSNDGITK